MCLYTAVVACTDMLLNTGASAGRPVVSRAQAPRAVSKASGPAQIGAQILVKIGEGPRMREDDISRRRQAHAQVLIVSMFFERLE